MGRRTDARSFLRNAHVILIKRPTPQPAESSCCFSRLQSKVSIIVKKNKGKGKQNYPRSCFLKNAIVYRFRQLDSDTSFVIFLRVSKFQSQNLRRNLWKIMATVLLLDRLFAFLISGDVEEDQRWSKRGDSGLLGKDGKRARQRQPDASDQQGPNPRNSWTMACTRSDFVPRRHRTTCIAARHDPDPRLCEAARVSSTLCCCT